MGEISDNTLSGLVSVFEDVGFTSSNLLKIFGKEVMRYVNISNLEKSFLRRQVLHKDENLLCLVDLFLLFGVVSKDKLFSIIPNEIVDEFVKAGLFIFSKDTMRSRVSIAPYENKFFFNDGMENADDNSHVLSLVLEQPYIIKATKFLLDTLSEEIRPQKICKILDICSGCGVVGQSLTSGYDAMLSGMDITPRAVSYNQLNARLNRLNLKCDLVDVTKSLPLEKYDLIVTNPPYNGLISDHEIGQFLPTLHSGAFGAEVVNAIQDNFLDALNDDGIFAMIGFHLMRNGLPANEKIRELVDHGTVLLLHQDIVPATSWEGIRQLYNAEPNFDDLAEGVIKELIEKARVFDSVCWGILFFCKGLNKGYKEIYNIPTDPKLLSPQAMNDIKIVIRANGE